MSGVSKRITYNGEQVEKVEFINASGQVTQIDTYDTRGRIINTRYFQVSGAGHAGEHKRVSVPDHERKEHEEEKYRKAVARAEFESMQDEIKRLQIAQEHRDLVQREEAHAESERRAHQERRAREAREESERRAQNERRAREAREAKQRAEEQARHLEQEYKRVTAVRERERVERAVRERVERDVRDARIREYAELEVARQAGVPHMIIAPNRPPMMVMPFGGHVPLPIPVRDRAPVFDQHGGHGRAQVRAESAAAFMRRQGVSPRRGS